METVAFIILGCMPFVLIFAYFHGEYVDIYGTRKERREKSEYWRSELRTLKNHHWEGCAKVKSVERYMGFNGIYVGDPRSARCTCWNEHMTVAEFEAHRKDLVNRLRTRKEDRA